ncbi:Glutathione S-transferase 2 [Rhinocladiella similis]
MSYPKGSAEYYETLSWLFFQNAGLGHMQGQANHFHRYAPEKIQCGTNRYETETKRLYGVLERHLKDSGKAYLVGDHVTIAGLSTFSWVVYAKWVGVEIAEYPTLQAWLERINAMPGVERGKEIPKALNVAEMTAEQRK